MKAEIQPKEFSKLVRLITKGVRGKKVRSKAIGLGSCLSAQTVELSPGQQY